MCSWFSAWHLLFKGISQLATFRYRRVTHEHHRTRRIRQLPQPAGKSTGLSHTRGVLSSLERFRWVTACGCRLRQGCPYTLSLRCLQHHLKWWVNGSMYWSTPKRWCLQKQHEEPYKCAVLWTDNFIYFPDAPVTMLPMQSKNIQYQSALIQMSKQ